MRSRQKSYIKSGLWPKCQPRIDVWWCLCVMLFFLSVDDLVFGNKVSEHWTLCTLNLIVNEIQWWWWCIVWTWPLKESTYLSIVMNKVYIIMYDGMILVESGRLVVSNLTTFIFSFSIIYKKNYNSWMIMNFISHVISVVLLFTDYKIDANGICLFVTIFSSSSLKSFSFPFLFIQQDLRIIITCRK